jgi:hypothetical protein
MGDDEKKSLADRMKSGDDDEKQSLANRMKPKGDDSGKSLADSKRDTQESASLKKRLEMSGEEADPSEVTRPSRGGFVDQMKDALERTQEKAEDADDDDEPKSLADKMSDKARHKDDDDEPKSLADRMKDDD